MKLDPRLMVISKRLSGVKKILAIMSNKGGVGKTVVATGLALAAADKGLKTGLLDLDFTNPSTHIVLGIDPSKITPEEEKGILPPVVHGIKYMTLAYYTGDNPVPLRGSSVDEVFKELLAITRWGELDLLVVDTPPGLGDENLDLLTYLGDKLEIVLVATPSRLSIASVEKVIKMLKDAGYKISGLIENMSEKHILKDLCDQYGIRYLGSILYDNKLEDILGNVNEFKRTTFYMIVSKILGNIL